MINCEPVTNPQREAHPTTIDTIQRPWRGMALLKEPEIILVMVRHNYKIEAYLRPTRWSLKRYSVLLHTGSESSFINAALITAALITAELQQLIRPLKNHINVRNAKVRVIMVASTVSLVVNVGVWISTTRSFNAVQRLETVVMLGCDLYDNHIEAIRPLLRIV